MTAKRKFFRFDPEKALQAILFVAKKLPGATFHQISKIIYFADKAHLQKYGRLICGDTYVAMKHGPVPSGIYDILKSVRGDGSSEYTEQARGSLDVQNRYEVIPKTEPNIETFSQSDIECLTNSIKQCGHLSFNELTELSHDKAWENADENDIIDLEQIIATLPDGPALLEHLQEQQTT